MQAQLRNVVVLGVGASAVTMLAACGGGSDSPAVNVNGKAVDFYLSKANVVFTDCGNQSTTTDDQGNFAFPANCPGSAVRVTGGRDIGTNLPFNGVLEAPASDPRSGSLRIVTPLTTLLVQAGADRNVLATRLGLQSDDILSKDPMLDAAHIRTAVVVEQLVEQIAKALLGLSATSGGSLTQAAAASAAAKAVAAVVTSATGSVDLTTEAVAASAITIAVKGVQSALPVAVRANIDVVAVNTAVLAAPLVAAQLANVNAALRDATLGATPAETLSTLQGAGSVNAVASSSASTLVTSLVAALTPDALGNATLATRLAEFAAAVVRGDFEQVQTLGNGLPVSAQGLVALVNAVKPTNFLQLDSLSVNDQTVDMSDSVTVGGGNLKRIKAAVSLDGKPFGENATEVRAGISYAYQGSRVDVVIDRIALVFDGARLVSAQVPANATYSLRVDGAFRVEASVSSRGESLSDVSGLLTLPIDTFLAKFRGAGLLSAPQIDALTPKAPGQAEVTVAVAGYGGKSLTIRARSAGKSTVIPVYTIDASKARTSGNGFRTTVTLTP